MELRLSAFDGTVNFGNQQTNDYKTSETKELLKQGNNNLKQNAKDI